MKALLRRRTLWILANVVGMGMYLWVASALWVRPGEEGMPGGSGDAFYWLIILVPILATFLAFNLIALLSIAREKSATRRPIALLLWVVIAVLWAATVTVDHQCAVRYIDAQHV